MNQPWDTFINKSTNQFGSSAMAPLGAQTPTFNESQMQQQQLATRRGIDDAIRYGRPVSDQAMANARRIGAI